MKIGDEVYIHGYIDEIRKDTVIIKNEGGYFGTAPSEIKTIEQGPKQEHLEDMYERSAICSYCHRNNILHGDYCKWCGQRWGK